jgi:hypothetical protein
VYVLGAGFSKPCGAPEQKDILAGVLNIQHANSSRLKNFLTTYFGHSDNIPLEDIFTALDRSIAKNEILRRFGIKELLAVRDDLNDGIIRLFKEKLEGKRINYIDQFAEKLLHLRFEDRNQDRVAVISTNWDILLDNALETQMRDYDMLLDGSERTAYLDYCTYTQSLDPGYNIPSTQIKARGYTNIKLLKLHGSMNWLLCPNCESLYNKFGEKVALWPQTDDIFCRICKRNHSHRIQLRPVLISPTFIKDLNSVHFKTIWWNAGFELSEATHVVFIGYSLPLSDFDLRYLLARHIESKAKIRVVLYSNNDRMEGEVANTAKRYVDFFGHRRLQEERDFDIHGVEDYVNNLTKMFW